MYKNMHYFKTIIQMVNGLNCLKNEAHWVLYVKFTQTLTINF